MAGIEEIAPYDDQYEDEGCVDQDNDAGEVLQLMIGNSTAM